MELDKVTDSLLKEEYQKRFFINPGSQIGSAKASAEHLRALFVKEARDQEHFAVIFLNQQNQILVTRILFTGTLNTAAVYPRELIKQVIRYEAAAVIIGHTHPSGGIQPSSSDRAVTTKIKNALISIDVELLDHLIIGNVSDGYYSFSDNNLL